MECYDLMDIHGVFQSQGTFSAALVAAWKLGQKDVALDVADRINKERVLLDNKPAIDIMDKLGPKMRARDRARDRARRKVTDAALAQSAKREREEAELTAALAASLVEERASREANTTEEVVMVVSHQIEGEELHETVTIDPLATALERALNDDKWDTNGSDPEAPPGDGRAF